MWIAIITAIIVLVGGGVLLWLKRQKPPQQVPDEQIQRTKERAAQQLIDIDTSIEQRKIDKSYTPDLREFSLKELRQDRGRVQKIYDDMSQVQKDRAASKQSRGQRVRSTVCNIMRI